MNSEDSDPSYMSPAFQASVSRNLGRILRYEAHKYDISQDRQGWYYLHEIVEKCQLPYSSEQVLYVAQNSRGGKGPRFQVEFVSKGIVRLKATYKNPPLANNQKGGGKPMNGANGRGGGKGENGYHNGYSNGYSNGSANGHGPGSEGDHAPRFGTNRSNEEKSSGTFSQACGNGMSYYSASADSSGPWPPRQPSASCSAWDGRGPPADGPSLAARSSQAPAASSQAAAAAAPEAQDAGQVDEAAPACEEWNKFPDDDGQRHYYYHMPTREYFYPEDANTFGWTKYEHDSSYWWCHVSGRFFFEPVLTVPGKT